MVDGRKLGDVPVGYWGTGKDAVGPVAYGGFEPVGVAVGNEMDEGAEGPEGNPGVLLPPVKGGEVPGV